MVLRRARLSKRRDRRRPGRLARAWVARPCPMGSTRNGGREQARANLISPRTVSGLARHHSWLAPVSGVGTSGEPITVSRTARRMSHDRATVRPGIGLIWGHDLLVGGPRIRVPCGIQKKAQVGAGPRKGRVQPDSVFLRDGRRAGLPLPDLAHPVGRVRDDGWRRPSLPRRRVLPAMLAGRAGAAGLATAGAMFTLGQWGTTRLRE